MSKLRAIAVDDALCAAFGAYNGFRQVSNRMHVSVTNNQFRSGESGSESIQKVGFGVTSNEINASAAFHSATYQTFRCAANIFFSALGNTHHFDAFFLPISHRTSRHTYSKNSRPFFGAAPFRPTPPSNCKYKNLAVDWSQKPVLTILFLMQHDLVSALSLKALNTLAHILPSQPVSQLCARTAHCILSETLSSPW